MRFLTRQTDRNSPTVEPLRIHKRESTNSPTPSSNSQHTAGTSGSGHYPIPSLPYPDDRQRLAQSRPTNASQAPYPYPDLRRGATPEQKRVGSPEQGRIGSPSYASPTQAGSPSDYPTSLRPHDGRDGRSGATLAERRGNAPKPLPESPGPEIPDKEGLFQKAPRRHSAASPSGIPELPGAGPRPSGPETNPFPDYHQQYWPPPGALSAETGGAAGRLNVRDAASVQRISSTASTSTTKATRGSPPPPETPIVPPNPRPGTDIEARYAAAGIAGPSTLTNLQAQNAAAMQRTANYAGVQPNPQSSASPPRRPWTPTEQPGSQPHGPPTVYQGPGEAQQQPPLPDPTRGRLVEGRHSPHQPGRIPPNPLENDFQRLHVSEEPPPAYSQTPGSQAGYSHDKERPAGTAGAAGAVGAVGAAGAAGAAGGAGGAIGGLAAAMGVNPVGTPSSVSQASSQGHPAYANDTVHQQAIPHRQPSVNGVVHHPQQAPAPAVLAAPAPNLAASPPPLPEGWIAHLDPNSGQYYYIHLPTQSTQWEFPKGPTPLNLNETPLSPVASAYNHPLASPGLSFANKPLASPGLPMTPGYEHVNPMSLGGSISGQAGYTGPPPSSGVDLYKVVPTNGVYFGPYLRYANMDLELELWLGSILLVTDGPQPPTIHIHQSLDLSPNPRQLQATQISQHQRWMFYKYEIDLKMEDAPAKWTYAITSHLGCTRYEFLVAGRYETNWRFVAHSGNDFGLNVSTNERARLGGVGYMWRDIMQKHAETGGFHCQLGLGSQIYADRLWKEIPSLKQWLATSGKENRKNAVWTAAHEEDVSHAYFHYYTSHFDQPHLREAFAQIPHILTLDDHDIFDGFGSYPEYMQFSNMFKNIGRIGIEMYLLFQHHTTLEILRNVSHDNDLFTITGTGWHFVKFLGPALVVVGPDTRSERNPHQVMAGPTYQGLFPKIAMLPPSVQHCIMMIAVPIVYPRMEAAESLTTTIQTGKKAVTGTYNLLGKVTSSVAGVVGAKGAVGSGFDSVKRAVGKSGLMGGILSPFGDIDVLDELKDQWTHESKDLERTYLIRTLQGISHQRSIRITFLSGSVSTCGAGLLHDPSHPSSHKTMFQLITSPVVNAPPSSYILKLLHNNKPLYIPQNGHRSEHHSSHHHHSSSAGGKGAAAATTDTKEDMMEIFGQDVDGRPREMRRLMNRRNYVAVVAYDPEVVQGQFGRTDMSGAKAGGRLSLAVDFMVQADAAAGAGVGAYAGVGGVVKFGPVVVPSLEFGR
ncbi:hypothetical protein EPUS_04854 [Endocarpon pusillum Z07020]|uniref:WW domain-containing protein n=1 Tax=Endocarpon pusillum (strain Z07020 / HMAS-L-300199) TaxID=1263415 RepID=U1GBY5_ENDPU|nr:uncharacterized protein EPUS_04854 [Endocarpon pusillum Z07020]ERF75072.1 hypothetical protein EPUS_04854 [Endocarpon pusillum Z07020]